MAAHTMTKEDFWHMKTLLMESGMSAKDFARTWPFCRLQIALTVNNFSSEKIILSMSVHAFNLLKKSLLDSVFFLFGGLRVADKFVFSEMTTSNLS